MTLYQFKMLTEEQQADVVWGGMFLDIRNEKEHNILLYAVDEFYVEVYYSPLLNKIERLQPFRSINPLEPYLDSFNVNDLH